MRQLLKDRKERRYDKVLPEEMAVRKEGTMKIISDLIIC